MECRSRRNKAFIRTDDVYHRLKVQLENGRGCQYIYAVVGFKESLKWT